MDTQICIAGIKFVYIININGDAGQLKVVFECTKAFWIKTRVYTTQEGDRGSTVVKVLCYKSEGRWFDPSWCQWIFIDKKSLRSHYGTGVDSTSNRNDYQEYLLGVNAACA